MLLLFLVSLLLPLHLSRAIVDIEVTESEFIVTVEYSFDPVPTELTLRAIRLPGQQVVIANSSTTLDAVSTGSRARWIARTEGPLSIVYRVERSVDRVPIMIPDETTLPGEGEVLIRVHGSIEGIDLADGFPRLQLAEDGSIVTTPANLPSMVVLPIRTGVSVARVSDAVVLLLLAVGSVYWLWRRGVVRP